VEIYKLGQKYGTCDNHCDLLHHKAGEERIAGSFPCDAKSAGLDWDGGKSVPDKHPPFAGWFLDPYKYSGGISSQDGFIDG
jgi:hypothetical protein